MVLSSACLSDQGVFIKACCGLLTVDGPEQPVSCLSSSKAQESGSWGINRAFVLVVSSLCSPAEAPGGRLGGGASFLGLQRICSGLCQKSHCPGATNGVLEAD